MGHCWVERKRRINSDLRGEAQIIYLYHMGTLTKNVGVLDSQNSFGSFEVKQSCVLDFLQSLHTRLCA